MDFVVNNLDSIFKILLAGASLVGFFFALRNEVTSIKSEITYIKENQKQLSEAFSQLGSILTKVAVQDTRLNMLEKKIDELSHGLGFVEIIRK